MFLAFSLLLVGWQACYAAHHDDYKISVDEYVRRTDYSLRPDYVLRPVQFNRDMSFGVSSSAYQIEGAWNKDGKGENIWDRFLHTNRRYANGSNGDVAANAYYKMEEDIELLKFLNVGHYKMSISWSRLLPNGLITYVNPAAVEHYRKQFKLLRKNQIEPFVTLYHWDLPQYLQDMGGFQNESIITWFSDYARVAFDLFGEDVKYWSTFNEPYQICANGYGSTLFAPGVNKSGVADYICGHNLIKAHAAAWHVYDKEFRKDQGGRISMNIGFQWIEPTSDSPQDRLAAQVQRQFYVGWFAHPIYLGDYPKVMKDRVKERSGLEGRSKSRLPEFSRKEVEYIKGTHDYFSLNSDIILGAKAIQSPLYTSRLQYDVGAKLYPKYGNHTYGLRKVLAWIKNEYGNPSIFITESGVRFPSATLEDSERITIMQKSLSNVDDAINLDGVRVYGYTPYLMDGFEWINGYSVYSGLFKVDFKDPKRPRTPRKSAYWYKQLCSTGCTGDSC